MGPGNTGSLVGRTLGEYRLEALLGAHVPAGAPPVAPEADMLAREEMAALHVG